MSHKCPFCGAEIFDYTLAGVYLHPDDDIPYLEKDGHVPMRWSGQFQALAMIECPKCGQISFMSVNSAKEKGLTKQASPLETE
ncbi:MAG: hypothetical protein SOV63_03665 [Pyramidobacter porci]|uniref:hypothetical protein n=1 Tax=Pyramidobacter porci TaxID=2605789 RepID=UPI002A7565C8|nr:hypothetical protein [Pyramidobacter porci]MCI6261512.1 hypothetical protein [Pyramidobacter sp.]MDY2647885.1 hypothetical protein [Pyramidobacter porci]